MFGQPERISIHKLTIPEIEKPKPVPFDPKRDLNEKELADIDHEYKKWISKKNFVRFAKFALDRKMILGEKHTFLDLQNWQTDRIVEQVEKSIVSYKNRDGRRGNKWTETRSWLWI